MGFYLIGPLVTLIPLGSISSWAFKPYCDDGLLGISPTEEKERMKAQTPADVTIILAYSSKLSEEED